MTQFPMREVHYPEGVRATDGIEDAGPLVSLTHEVDLDDLMLTLARQLQNACRACPVLQQCAARRDAAKPDDLYGVVAGRVIRRSTKRVVVSSADPPFSIERAPELRAIGWTAQDIADRYNVSLSTVKRHLRKAHRHNREAAA